MAVPLRLPFSEHFTSNLNNKHAKKKVIDELIPFHPPYFYHVFNYSVK
jgi:hypothetical protein